MTDETNEDTSFEDWIEILNACAETQGYADKPLTSVTGAECWRDYYDNGFTPEEALLDDDSW